MQQVKAERRILKENQLIPSTENKRGRRVQDSNPIPLDPPVTRAVIPSKDHLLLLLLVFSSAISL